MGYERFSPKQRKVLTWWMPGDANSGYEAIVCDGAVGEDAGHGAVLFPVGHDLL